MTVSLLFGNLLAWSAQAAVIIAIAACAAWFLKDPRAKLLFWQGTLAIVLLLPVELWILPAPEASGTVSVATGVALVADAKSPTRVVWRGESLLAVIAAGALLRMIWIAAGFARLRRHRLSARSIAPLRAPVHAPRVRWYLSDTVSGPVTFGWLRPSILLPSRINELPDDLRAAIACHELIHVERRDWLFVLAEEGIRAVLWFHPAIWFALGQIQLTREQTVDREVVRLTRDRGRYLDALVAVAAQKLRPDVVPAPLFLKRRQLAMRVAAVLKETRMSKSNLAARFLTVSTAAMIAARVAVLWFPLQSPVSAQTAVMDSPGIAVDAGAPLMHRVPVGWPAGVTATGTVLVDASLDSKGEVSDVRVVSGPEELRKPVLQSVLQWHYSTEAGAPQTVHVSVRFSLPPLHRVTSDVRPLPETPQQTQATLKTIEIRGASPQVEQEVRGRLPVREGDQVNSGRMPEILSAAHQIDEHFRGTLNIGVGGWATLVLELGLSPSTGAPAKRIRIDGNVQSANLISKVTPVYPPDAKAARVQGMVRFTATINKEGAIQTLELVSGDPLLVPSATDAVKQWVYRPTLLNGQPIEVITLIDVNYTLTK